MARSAACDAEVRAIEDRFEAFRGEVEAFRCDVEWRLRGFRLELDQLLARNGEGRVPAPVTPTAVQPALVFIAEQARRAAEKVAADGEVILALQGPAFSVPALAGAYYGMARATEKRSELREDASAGKQGLLFLRDLLVLKVCIGTGPWSNPSLQSAFSDVFAASETDLDTKLTSQLILAFNTIVRCGRDRATFDSTAPKVYGEPLDGERAEELFAAFRACADTSPGYISNAKAVRKGKQKPNRPKSRPPADVPSHPSTVPEPQEPQEPQEPEPEVGAAGAAVDHSEPDPSEPCKVAVPKWLQHSAVLCVKNTFLEFREDRSVSSLGRHAKTAPTMRGFVAVVGEEDDGGASATEHGRLSDVEEGDGESEKMPAAFREWRPCNDCGAEDPNGWPDKYQKFRCSSCWKKYNNEKNRRKGVTEDAAADGSTPGGPGGPAERYDALDPVVVELRGEHATEIQVRNECCISVAEAYGSKACLLVMGREHGPLSEHKFGQGSVVMKQSTLQEAIRLSIKPEDRDLPVPRWGGIYVPDVLVKREPQFRVSMVYACAERADSSPDGNRAPPSSAAASDVMQEKIRNVLRICHRHGHEQLVLGAWGCGWREMSARTVAEAFKDTLFGGNSEFKGCFSQIAFAIVGEDANTAQTLDVFKEVFAPFASPGAATAGLP